MTNSATFGVWDDAAKMWRGGRVDAGGGLDNLGTELAERWCSPEEVQEVVALSDEFRACIGLTVWPWTGFTEPTYWWENGRWWTHLPDPVEVSYSTDIVFPLWLAVHLAFGPQDDWTARAGPVEDALRFGWAREMQAHGLRG